MKAHHSMERYTASRGMFKDICNRIGIDNDPDTEFSTDLRGGVFIAHAKRPVIISLIIATMVDAANEARHGKILKTTRRYQMTMYRVTYNSMSAFYGPSYIEAESEYEARRKFARNAFSQNEMSLIRAVPVSLDEMRRALANMDDEAF